MRCQRMDRSSSGISYVKAARTLTPWIARFDQFRLVKIWPSSHGQNQPSDGEQRWNRKGESVREGGLDGQQRELEQGPGSFAGPQQPRRPTPVRTREKPRWPITPRMCPV
jgi:hypothetical protein